ncbi:MAG: class I SAM-dependent methyltransferase [Lachnospiraceae bacterium]|nr:class I SAM-dependent methyltransferase [Lachnospiraceae bacterium]
MAKQNIYDNEIFFEGYKKIREREVNANILFEMPALFSLLPELKGKRVLDLGCGFGEHCKKFVEMGAEKVVGIDISEKMLEVAKQENSDEKIEYLRLPMEDLDKVDGKFDVVISSLAMHYIDDFDGVVGKIADKLTEGGYFIYSQEHPLNTCHTDGERWTRDENGKKLHVNVKNYCVESEKESEWFVEGVKKYHRMFSTIINTLTDNGFIVEKVLEPYPDEEIIAKYPDYSDNLHKPDFMLIKAKAGTR